MSFNLDGIRPKFGGHEKFVFRYSWLKKGVDASAEDPLIFSHDEALVKLGVGKNMVRSIRYWCLATGMLEVSDTVGRAVSLKPTSMAKNLLIDGGWDPYLENVGSLWLLHWMLVSNLTFGLVWHLAFSAYIESEFNKKQLANFISKQFSLHGIRTTSRTIDREVDCCMRTYIPTKTSRDLIIADTFDCPLSELELIRFFPDSASYNFNIGPKASLHPAIFGYALLSYLPKLINNRRTIVVDECIYTNGSPGQAFKLDENSVIVYLEWLEQATQGGLRLEETAGLRQVYLSDSLIENLQTQSIQILRHYYGRNS